MVKQRTNNGTAVTITKRSLKHSGSSAQAGPSVTKTRGRKSNVGAESGYGGFDRASSKTSKKSNSRFNKFEREQEARLQEAMELINGESGVVNVWVSEMKNIALSVMKKMDEKLNHENNCIKNLKLEFEKYQSVTTETLDHLAKIHTHSQRFRRELDNELKRIYTTDETELNESLEHFIKDQRQVRKSLVKSNKEIHDMSALKRMLSEV
ncbi:8753_t:CDS:2 [Cetraspora pellucida]|uniref:8753_t:CDS:1 n=1 Tax=Cetraspora pellucida TaxID=1433469 RepID=A0A9N8YTR1_9GLOM|nr:8753_t:CDS:2 [Cetraspora pellucida]